MDTGHAIAGLLSTNVLVFTFNFRIVSRGRKTELLEMTGSSAILAFRFLQLAVTGLLRHLAEGPEVSNLIAYGRASEALPVSHNLGGGFRDIRDDNIPKKTPKK